MQCDGQKIEIKNQKQKTSTQVITMDNRVSALYLWQDQQISSLDGEGLDTLVASISAFLRALSSLQ